RERDSLRLGAFHWLYASGPGLAFARTTQSESTYTVLNAGDFPLELSLSWSKAAAYNLLSGQTYWSPNGFLTLQLPPRSGMLITE
ncbi:MAG: alpha-glucosidase C-terminal domain-containing protein, partial [Lentisphaeria bacterium]